MAYKKKDTRPGKVSPIDNSGGYVRPGYFDEYEAYLDNPNIDIGGGGSFLWKNPHGQGGGVSRTPATTIKETKPKTPINALVSGAGARLALAYGHLLLPGHVTAFTVNPASGKPVLQMTWCKGEVNAVLNVYIGNDPEATVDYLGTQVQGVDSTLAALIAGYTDTLLGVCYSSITVDVAGGIKRYMAEVEARKCFDIRTSTTIYTQNPAIQFRDAALLAGLTPDDNTIEDTADACDVSVGGAPRRQCNIYFDQPISVDDCLQTLAEYAGAFYIREGGIVRLIPDRPVAVSVAFSNDPADTGHVQMKEGTFAMRKDSKAARPNYVRTAWTDTSVFPWRVRYATAPDAIPADYAPTTFEMDGWHSHEEAKRHSIERVNAFQITDLNCEFEAFDDALELEAGDVFTATHTTGLTDKPFRATEVLTGEDIGHWFIQGHEYDPAQYSDSVVPAGTIPDIVGANPEDIPAGPDPTAAEKLFIEEGGRTLSRLEISWPGADWNFVNAYRVEVLEGAITIMDFLVAHLGGSATTHKTVTPAVAQGIQYTVNIYIQNVFLTIGPVCLVPAVITAQGKLLKPQPVPQASMVCYEFGFFVKVEHDPASDIDLVGYRYKRLLKTDYDAAADDDARWNHANVVVVKDRHDSPGDIFVAQPVGVFMYGVRSLDSVGLGQESESSAWCEVEVTEENSGQLAITKGIFGVSGVVHLYELYGASIGGDAATSHGSGEDFVDLWGVETDPFPVDQTISFIGATGSIHKSAMASYRWDTGIDRSGVWASTPHILVALNGASLVREVRIATEADFATFEAWMPNGSAGFARYMESRVRVWPWVANHGFTIVTPLNKSFQGQKRNETLVVNIPVSPQPHAFVWAESYSSKPSYSYVIEDTEPVIVAFDNVTKDGGDVRCWAAEGHSVYTTPGEDCPTTIEIKAEGV